jgi:hypothetical protein
VRPIEIVDNAPAIEGALRGGEITQALKRKHLSLEVR